MAPPLPTFHLALLLSLLLPLLLAQTAPTPPYSLDNCDFVESSADSTSPVFLHLNSPPFTNLSGTDFYYHCYHNSENALSRFYFFHASLGISASTTQQTKLDLTFEFPTAAVKIAHNLVNILPIGSVAQTSSRAGNLCTYTSENRPYAFPSGLFNVALALGGAAEEEDGGGDIEVDSYEMYLLDNTLNASEGIGASRTLDVAELETGVVAFVATGVQAAKEEAGVFTWRLTLRFSDAETSVGTLSSSSDCSASNATAAVSTFELVGAEYTIEWRQEPGAWDNYFFQLANARTITSATLVFGDPTPSPAPSVGPVSDDPCFPASAMVHRPGLAPPTRIDELRIGDLVATGRSEGVESAVSLVFLFTHRDAEKVYPFVRLHTADGGAVALSGSHYIFANGKLTAARHVDVGDELERGDGEMVRVVAKEERVMMRGLYNPHTAVDVMVVDGFKVSCFTMAVPPPLARALLWPMKLVGFGVPEAVIDAVRWMTVGIPRGRETY